MADQSFAKHQRLLTAKEFQKVFDGQSIKVSSAQLLILAATNGQAFSRIGFIIAKKNIRTAVQRNRIKRLAREYFRIHGGSFSGYDIILLARRGLDTMSNQEIHTFLEQQWQRLVRKHQQSKLIE